MNESSAKQDLIFLVLQYLRESGFNESLHELESQSRVFFDIKYFEILLLKGKWEEAERYLSGFTKVDENEYSLELFYIIRQQKYFDALDNHDKAKAAEILKKELKFFSTTYNEGFKHLSSILMLKSYRERKGYSYTMSFKNWYVAKAKDLIEKNPVFHNKLEFPIIENDRLQTLLRQSFDYQHFRCENKVTCPKMKTLLKDHLCDTYAFQQEAKEKEKLGPISFNVQNLYEDHFSPARFLSKGN